MTILKGIGQRNTIRNEKREKEKLEVIRIGNIKLAEMHQLANASMRTRKNKKCNQSRTIIYKNNPDRCAQRKYHVYIYIQR